MDEIIKNALQEDEEAVLVVYPQWSWTAPNVLSFLIFEVLWLLFLAFFTCLAIQSRDLIFQLGLIPFWVIAVVMPLGVLWCRVRLNRTVYLVTNKRAVVLRPAVLSLRLKTISWPLAHNMVKRVDVRKNGLGDVVLGFRDYEINGRRVPGGFISVPEVKRVHEILQEQIVATCGPADAVAPPPPAVQSPAAAPAPAARQRQAPWWFGLFFMIPGLLEVGLGWSLRQEDIAMETVGVRTTAKVVEIDTDDSAPMPQVEYADAAGATHKVRSSYGSSEFNHLRKGDSVEIFYLPENPQEIKIVTEDFLSMHWLMMMMGSVFVIVGLMLCIVLARKKRAVNRI